MNRTDWLWLTIKAAGIYLILVGIEQLSGPAESNGQRLGALLPLAIGLFVLFADPSRWLQRIVGEAGPVQADPAQTAPATAPTALTREDWLWVGSKLLGAYLIANGMLTIGNMLTMVIMSAGLVALMLIGSIAYLVFGCMLLFGDRLWRRACRGGTGRPAE
ncbi:MAG: hypothetical protein H6838_12330 [Planctomycetes bacterium]|nr:hypothetical protein [Planctomycetota bacterium]